MALLRGGRATPAEVVRKLTAAVAQHSAGARQHDDITVVCFGRKA